MARIGAKVLEALASEVLEGRGPSLGRLCQKVRAMADQELPCLEERPLADLGWFAKAGGKRRLLNLGEITGALELLERRLSGGTGRLDREGVEAARLLASVGGTAWPLSVLGRLCSS